MPAVRSALPVNTVRLPGWQATAQTSPRCDQAGPALRAALEAWKGGKSQQDLADQTPSIIMNEDDWRGGKRLLDYTVDVSPYKQSHFLPGTHLPVKAPETLRQTRPDVVLILPWNLTTEIVEQHSYIRDWGGRFATFWPEPSFLT